eukprot:3792127-Pyramimonas_sp.AAC.1
MFGRYRAGRKLVNISFLQPPSAGPCASVDHLYRGPLLLTRGARGIAGAAGARLLVVRDPS